MKSLTFLGFLLFCNSLIQAQSLEVQLRKIDSIVESKLQQDHPGLAVGIVKNGEIIYEKYRGLSNLQHQISFNKNTRSNIASTAKQFTALMILKLTLEDKLNLEEDLRVHLPELYKNVEDNIKIRHVLNHTSGIRDYVELLDLEGNVWWQRFGLDNDDVMELLEKQEDLGFKPGSMYSYSNSNYIVLTKIVEKVSGQSFNEYSKAFFESLGMNETSFVEKYMAVIPNRANPYSDWGSGEWMEVPTVTKTNGEGFLFTTLKDQLLFEQMIQNADRDNNLLLIESQQAIPNSEINTYGFGLELKDQLGRMSVFHSGGTYGFHSQADRYPDDQLTIFAMSNNGNISTNLIAKEIAKMLLPQQEQIVQYDSKFNQKSSVEVQTQGQYDYPNNDKLVRITKEDGKLFWKEGNYFNLALIKEGLSTYSFQNKPKLKVVFYEDEMVEYYPSGKTMVYRRNKNEPASVQDLESFSGVYQNTELDISFELKLTEEGSLKLKFSNDKNDNDVQVFNNAQLLAGNSYNLEAERDAFGRVINMVLSYGRAQNMLFKKKTDLIFQPKIATENGSINVTTIGSLDGETSDILLTANYPNGNEIWFKRLGGKSYDKANSILATEDGYLIIGSTSSFGMGNYDFYVIKTDKKGNKVWQKTYGKSDNDYGYSAEILDNGFIIKGTTQLCNSKDVLTRKCATKVWFVTIDKAGNEIKNEILEEVN